MAGSSRTLYQGSVDGWLPRYLIHVNPHGAPTRAMWTDLVFNLILLAIASSDATSFFFILAVSNCGYIIFNFLNLNAGLDPPHRQRPHPAAVQGADHHSRARRACSPSSMRCSWAPVPRCGTSSGTASIALGRVDRSRAHHPGVLLPPLRPGRREVPGPTCWRISASSTADLGAKKAGMLPYVTLAGGVGRRADRQLDRRLTTERHL